MELTDRLLNILASSMARPGLAAALAVGASAAYGREYHVALSGNNTNSGSAVEPLRTIQRAADLAQPGDTVTVHAGLYRERVNPPRGGISDEQRITYQAAPGEEVVIKGSEEVKGWTKVQDGVWKVTLPNGFFGDFNPYTDRIGGEWYGTPTFDRHTGAVYLNGDWLDEAQSLEQVLPSPEAQKLGNDVALGGKTFARAGMAIAGTEDDALYQTCRFDLKGYRLAVPNGTYRVTLKFCEPHFDAKGMRVFDVSLQGRAVLESFDILAKAAKFAAHDEVFEGIEVSDGQLKMDIANRVSEACISGIVVEGGDYSKKINCGGPDWEGYQRDPGPKDADLPPAHGRPLWFAQVDATHTTLWAQFRDVDPNSELVEINVRQSVFYPSKPGVNFITVRGFTMRHAATPWAGAMSEQIGLIGTHWSKGWIIENNVISHSVNTGVSLGRYDLGQHGIAKPPATAPGFVLSCELALKHGWSRENIGSHIVRNNHISHCEKNGIHGSLGGVFSTIENNIIHDIAVRGWVGGHDLAGLKLLGSNGVVIRDNHIYRCRGSAAVWLDWMAQDTRMTGNLLHDNGSDLFMEVNHGPFLIDHNLFLSGNSICDWSQGGAYAHNFVAGSLQFRLEDRQTPYFKPHSLEGMRISSIHHQDIRFYNNVFARRLNLPGGNLQESGNIFLGKAIPLEERDGEWFFAPPSFSAEALAEPRVVVTTELLGKAAIPEAPFEQRDGAPYRLDRDYFGRARNADTPLPGPFAAPGPENGVWRVWAPSPTMAPRRPFPRGSASSH